MSTRAWSLGFVGFFGLLAVSPLSAEDSTKSSSKVAGCVDVQADASFASVGFDHIVTLKSSCKKPMSCTVKTNVNPEAATLELDPGESKSVVTWRGSPAREFTPIVACAAR